MTNYELPLRYLIAVDDQLVGRAAEIIEVGYEGPLPKNGIGIRYGNLYDQTGSSRYGPYLGVPPGSTAEEYVEKIVNPLGVGWKRLLGDQCRAAKVAGFKAIEFDNPDGYSQAAVLDAVNFAADYGLAVAAKNPLICEWDAQPYVKHEAVIGIVVERDEGATPSAYDKLRKEVGRPDLPVWFVAFKDSGEDGRAWITQIAKEAVKFTNMWCSYSPDGEYTSSVDISMATKPPDVTPIVPGPPPLVEPKPSNFERCCNLLLVHEGGNDDDPRDPGGRTSRGIIQSEWNVYRQDHPGLPSDVWKAPQQDVLNIYQMKYWNAVRGDDLPLGIDYVTFDYGVNSGVSRGIRQLQTTLGMKVDGVIGPVTIAAAKAVSDVPGFINRYQDARLAFLKGLSTWSVFGRGWATRVADVRADAIGMVGGVVPTPPPPGPPMHNTLWVQQSLNKLGASPQLAEDGKMGPMTRTEIKEFQSTHGLSADGVAGPLTQAEITQALNATPQPPVLPGDATTPDSLLNRVIEGMAAKGYRIDTEPGQVNIVYAEGHDRDGKRNNNQPGYWNDVRMVFTHENNMPKLLGAWTATTQPGPYYTENPLNSGGAANIFPGQYQAWKVALHRGQYEALCQRGTLTLTRDKNKDYKREGDKVEVGDYEGINQHHGGDASTIGPHSAGCIVGKMIDGHQQFMSIVKSDPRYRADRNFMFTSAVLAQGEVPL